MVPRRWVQEEPLFYNQLIPATTTFSNAIQDCFKRAGLSKLGNLWGPEGWRTAQSVTEQIGFHSVRSVQKVLDGIKGALPAAVREQFENRSIAEEDPETLRFPGLRVTAAVGDWQEEEDSLLSFKTPKLAYFESVGKKQLYAVCVKISHLNELQNVKKSKWHGLLGGEGPSNGVWRCLYKYPLPKRSGDLQWRIVHGAISTNIYLAHLDPERSRECPFCPEIETLAHIFLQCPRLEDLFSVVRELCERLGLVFSSELFVFGPGYMYKKRWKFCLTNFILGQAKLAIWLTRRNKTKLSGPVCAKLLFRQMVLSRLKVEYAHAEIRKDVEGFKRIWAVDGAVCECTEDGYIDHVP